MSDDSGTSSDVAPHEAAEAAAASHEVKFRGRGRGRKAAEAAAASHEMKIRGRGRGRGRGRPRPRGSPSRPSKASIPKKRGIEKLKPVPCEELSDEMTSESPETKRIVKAQKKWDNGKKVGDDSDSEVSSDEAVRPSACEEPVSSSLTSFCRWMCEKVVSTPDEMVIMVQRLAELQVTMAEFCAGMCSASMAMKVLEQVLQQKTGHAFHVDTILVTEMSTWKARICQKVCSACGSEPRTFETTGEAARDANPISCAIAVLSIECDDISPCTSTPKGVMDTSGRSGRSFLEFVEYLRRLGHTQRPAIILVECVGNLHHVRHVKQAHERGTSKVSEQFSTFGYEGSWKILNAKTFAVPQSRSRVYGIFVKLSCFGPDDHVRVKEEVASMWSFVSKCQQGSMQPLGQFFTKTCGILEPDKKPKGKKKGRNQKESTAKNVPKWVQEHEKFKEKHGLSDGTLPDISKKILSCVADLNLSPREAELGALLMAVALKKHPDGHVFIGNIGDSVRYCSFKSYVYPCLLPRKKYLYVINSEVAVNTNPVLPLALQGLGRAEMTTFGLDSLSLAEAQDLAGNAFCVNIICAILLAVLAAHDFSAK